MLQIASERARQREREKERESARAHARATNSGKFCCIGLLMRALFMIILTKHKNIHDHLDCKHIHNDHQHIHNCNYHKNIYNHSR